MMSMLSGTRSLAPALLCVLAGVAIAAPSPSKTAEAEDSTAQRQYAWNLLKSLVPEGETEHPVFSQWHSEIQTFRRSGQPSSIPFPGTPATTLGDMNQSGHALHGAPLMTFIHYNDAAYHHIRAHRLYQKSTLDRLIDHGESDPDVDGLKTIPPLPEGAAIVMTAWWPVKKEGTTPLPVWEPKQATRQQGSNGYLSWPRLLGVRAERATAGERKPATLAFAGKTVAAPKLVALEQFYDLAVDRSLAQRLMANPQFRKAAIIAMGRPLMFGDAIALVGFHLMSASSGSGVWSTFWWHDQAEQGPFAAGRPDDLAAPWGNYLMDVTMDAELPREPDGSPNICFNPWFDGIFVDEGAGNGLKANCISCHARASYPLTGALRVTRGYPDIANDPAFSPGRLRTDFLWSIVNTEERLPAAE